MNDYLDSVRLDRLAIWWSLVRMVLVASVLLFGAVPLLGQLVFLSPFVPWLWVVSGLFSVYLGYRWFVSDMKLVSHNDLLSTLSFLLVILSGLNLGLASFSQNFGMFLVEDVLMSDFIVKAVGVLYLLVAGYLYRQWSESGYLSFDNSPAKSPEAAVQKVLPLKMAALSTTKVSEGSKESAVKAGSVENSTPSLVQSETAVKVVDKNDTALQQQTLTDSVTVEKETKVDSKPKKTFSPPKMDDFDLSAESDLATKSVVLPEVPKSEKPNQKNEEKPLSLEKRIEQENKTKSFKL